MEFSNNFLPKNDIFNVNLSQYLMFWSLNSDFYLQVLALFKILLAKAQN